MISIISMRIFRFNESRRRTLVRFACFFCSCVHFTIVSMVTEPKSGKYATRNDILLVCIFARFCKIFDVFSLLILFSLPLIHMSFYFCYSIFLVNSVTAFISLAPTVVYFENIRHNAKTFFFSCSCFICLGYRECYVLVAFC